MWQAILWLICVNENGYVNGIMLPVDGDSAADERFKSDDIERSSHSDHVGLHVESLKLRLLRRQ